MSTNLLIRTAEIGLFAFLLLHIVQGLSLWAKNRASRPVKYQNYQSGKTRKFYASSMGLLGTLILIFLVVHLRNFWVPSRFGGLAPVFIEGKEYHNLYLEMQAHFQIWWVVVIYVLGVVSLMFHLLHGFQSAAQTFGWKTSKYSRVIDFIGMGFSIAVCALFAAMPLAMFFNLIH
jgi:succinate dehydrogenase / fumarate reductase, cytochrome b subunit